MDVQGTTEQLAAMQAAVEQAEAAVSAIVGRRGQFALSAATGDTKATKSLSKLTDEETAAQRKLYDARLAADASMRNWPTREPPPSDACASLHPGAAEPSRSPTTAAIMA